MKQQGMIIAAIVFALIVAIFAVVNVDTVKVNYLFGNAEWPLILIILGSVLMGGLILGAVGFIRYYGLLKKYKLLDKENQVLKQEVENLKTEASSKLSGTDDKENKNEDGLK